MKIFFTILLSFLLLGCKAEKPLVIGISPVASSAGVFIAHEQKYFKKYGLNNVELTYFKKSGAPMTSLLANNQLHVGGGNLSTGLWNAINTGVKISLVADKGHIGKKSSYIGLLVRSDHIKSGRYKTPKDLKGFTMGLTSLGGVSQQILVEKILKKHQLKLSDVKFVKMSYSNMNISLESKSIDATIQLEPYLTKAILDGSAKKVLDGYDAYPEQQSAAIFFSPIMKNEWRDKGVRFLAAYIEGIRDYRDAFIHNKNKDKIISMLQKHVKISNRDIWNNMIPIGLDQNGSINGDNLQKDLEWYKSQNFLDNIPALSSVIDEGVLKEAQEMVLKYNE